MDYEQKYKKALERAKKLQETCDSQAVVGWCEYLFPELKESGDERIRKALIENFKWYCGDFPKTTKWGKDDNLLVKDIIAWLEKQDPQILANSAKTCKDEQKPATIDIDKMVDDYANNKERGNEEFGKPVPCMIRAYRQGLNDAIGKVMLKPAWSEEDEKIRQTIINEFEQCSEWYCSNGLTKEDCINWLNKQEYFKWGDEDNENMNSLCVLLDQMVSINAIGNEHSIEYKNWLKSLKDRVQPKQEWSKEDERILDALMTSLNNEVFAGRLETLKGVGISLVIDWLKSIKTKSIL